MIGVGKGKVIIVYDLTQESRGRIVAEEEIIDILKMGCIDGLMRCV